MPPKKTTAAKKAGRNATLSALVSSDHEIESGDDAPPPAEKPKRGRPAKPKSTAAEEPALPAAKRRATAKSKTAVEDDEVSAEEEEQEPEPVKKKPGRKPKGKPAEGGGAGSTTTTTEIEVEVKPPAKRGRPPSAATLAKRAAAEAKEKEKEKEKQAAVEEEKDKECNGKPLARGRRKKEEKEQEVVETQMVDAMDIDEEDDEEEENEEVAATPTQVHSKGRRGGRNAHVVTEQESKEEDESGDEEVSQSEVGSDEEDELASAPKPSKKSTTASKSKPSSNRATAAQRFKLQSLTETEPERLLREFRALSTKESAAAEKTISTLKTEVERQSKLASKSKNLQAQLDAQAKETQKLQAKIAELTKALADEKKENTILSAKLTAAKSAGQGIGGPPGSTVKPKIGVGMGMMGKEEDWVKKEKVQLFEDLTNLIILGAKKDGNGTTFECLQSGRNGSLHFKLCVRDPNRQRNKKPKPANGAAAEDDEDDDDDDDFIFIPQLDPARDAFVISILPDYLRGEIAFTRENAANFYNRINKVLAQQIVEVSDGEEEEETDEEGDEEEEYESGEESGHEDTEMADE